METSQAVRTTAQVANRLVELCRTGQYEAAQEELFADDATSAEPAFTNAPVVKGRQAIIEKGKEWAQSVKEFHGTTLSEPIIGGDYFSVASSTDVTFHKSGRMTIEEINVYHVKNGQVVSEQFFY